ncbi:hypothetical protein BDC45DRAFT_238987 [Circinella umbellata]|nr:hypothetical protein BDC45DRAFT_238987 [Circinella umbellata]
MEDNRVPSFVQYPQKRKRTISNNVTSSPVRAYKRHESASFLARSETILVDETQDVMQCFTHINEEAVDTIVPNTKEKMDVEETVLMGNGVETTATTVSDEVKETNIRKREERNYNTGNENVITIEQKQIKDDENNQSIDPALILLNTPTTTTTSTTTTDEKDNKDNGSIQNSISKEQHFADIHGNLSPNVEKMKEEKERVTPAQLLSYMETTVTEPTAVITLTNDVMKETALNKDIAITTTTLTTDFTEKHDESKKQVTEESTKNSVQIRDGNSQDVNDNNEDVTKDDSQDVNDNEDVTMDDNDKASKIKPSTDKEKDINTNVTLDNEDDNNDKDGESSRAVDESSQEQVIKNEQTPWLSSIWSTLTFPFRSKK